MSDQAGAAVLGRVPPHGVVVPVFNDLTSLAHCARGLLACALPATRIVFVDDGSEPPAAADPGLREVLADRRVTVLRHARNRGVAAARNSALAWCRREGLRLVLMVDSDCEVPADFVTAHLRLHAEHPETACVAGAVEGVGAGFWAALDRVMTWVHGTGAAGELRHPYHATTANFSAKLDRLPARRAVFDERLRTGEDALLTRELRRHGQTVRFSPVPCVTHHDRDTWRGVLWHHYQYGHHHYFVQLGGDFSARCLRPAYRAAFTVVFLPVLPLFAFAGSLINLAPWLRRRPSYALWFPFMYLLWLAKGVAVLQSALAPWRSLRSPVEPAGEESAAVSLGATPGV